MRFALSKFSNLPLQRLGSRYRSRSYSGEQPFLSMARRLESLSSIYYFQKIFFSTPLSRSYHLPSVFRTEISGRFAVSARFSGHNQVKSSRQYNTNDARRSSPIIPLPPVNAEKIELLRELEAALGSSFSSEPLAPPPNPLIVVISGPSGVGKDAVIKRLREVQKGIHFVVTATSREKRPGEVDGQDYYFVTKEQFLSMVEKNELLEYALVYGDYKGIPKQQIRDFMSKGFDIVLRVDIQGAATLRSILGNSAIFIFLVAENEATLVKRLVDRNTETTDALLVRIVTAREEVKHLKKFDYVVVNAEGKLESSVNLIGSIIDAEKARVRQHHAYI